jgi:hypothetical protein
MASQIPFGGNGSATPGITDLARQLGADAKRLVADEARLAKLEMSDSVHRAGHGAVWLAAAFGTTVAALVAFTILFAALVGRVANGNYWVGAFAAAAIDLAVGWWLVRRGMRELKSAL